MCRFFTKANFLKYSSKTRILRHTFASHSHRNYTNHHGTKRLKNYWSYIGLFTAGAFGYGFYKFSANFNFIQDTIPCVNARTIENDNLPPSRRFNFIADAVEAVEPAVVYIEVTDARVAGIWGHHSGPTSSGSGFFVTEEGLVLTNAHVVANAIDVTVKLRDGRQYKGVVVDIDPIKDLAAIKLNASEVYIETYVYTWANLGLFFFLGLLKFILFMDESCS